MLIPYVWGANVRRWENTRATLAVTDFFVLQETSWSNGLFGSGLRGRAKGCVFFNP